MPVNYISKINVNSTDYVFKAANGAPAGGSAGQVLSKVSGADFDFAWSNAGGGGGGGGYVPLSTAVVTLASSDWDSSTPEGYMQTVTVTGMTSTANVWVSPTYSTIYNYAERYATDQIVCTAQGTDSLTFRRYASSSSGDIVLNIMWTEDSSDQLIPSGGTTGQVLAKTSGADYAVGWVDQSGGGGLGGVIALSSATVTLTSAGWVESSGAYMQTVTVSGMTSTADAWVSPSYSSSVNYAERYATDMIVCTGQGSNSLTFRRYASSSSGDISVDVMWTANIAGQTVPSGGSAGQVLTKTSSTDYDTAWTTVSGSSPIAVFEATAAITGLALDTATITLDGYDVSDLSGNKPSALYIKNFNAATSIDFNCLMLLNVDDYSSSTFRIDGVAYCGGGKQLTISGTFANSATTLTGTLTNVPKAPKTATVTLASDSWSGTMEGYMQTVTVTGMTSSATVWAAPAYATLYNYARMYATDQIVCSAQATDSLTFRRYANTSSGNIVVNITWIP